MIPGPANSHAVYKCTDSHPVGGYDPLGEKGLLCGRFIFFNWTSSWPFLAGGLRDRYLSPEDQFSCNRNRRK